VIWNPAHPLENIVDVFEYDFDPTDDTINNIVTDPIPNSLNDFN
jgi:hypothetical protein